MANKAVVSVGNAVDSAEPNSYEVTARAFAPGTSTNPAPEIQVVLLWSYDSKTVNEKIQEAASAALASVSIVVDADNILVVGGTV